MNGRSLLKWLFGHFETAPFLIIEILPIIKDKLLFLITAQPQRTSTARDKGELRRRIPVFLRKALLPPEGAKREYPLFCSLIFFLHYEAEHRKHQYGNKNCYKNKLSARIRMKNLSHKKKSWKLSLISITIDVGHKRLMLTDGCLKGGMRVKPLMLKETEICIGIEKPFQLLHVTDTHISLADERDDERKQNLALRRAKEFEGNDPGCCMRYFRESCDMANTLGATLVHTGDLFDFVSEKHLEIAPELISMANNYFMAAGNHEYSLYVGEAFEDEMYKARSFSRVQAALSPCDLRFASRIVNGVNLISVDNVYYYFSEYARKRLTEEAEKGLPMILFFHNPLYTPELYEECMEKRKNECCYAVGVPIEKMRSYSEHRFRQQVASPDTERFMEYLYSLTQVKAVFAGHLHDFFESPLPSGVMQYVTGAQYNHEARLITVK